MQLQEDTLSVSPALVNPGPCLQITQELLASFQEWLLREQGTSEDTARKYMYYLPRLEGFSLYEKADVSKAFSLMGLNKTSYEAFSRLLTYIEKKTSHEDLALSLRRALPRKPKSSQDACVLPVSLVASMPTCLERLGEAHTLAIKLVQARWGPKCSNRGGYSISPWDTPLVCL